MRRHLRQEHELVRAHPQDVEQHRLDVGQRPLAERGEQRVERAEPAADAEHEVRDEPAVLRREFAVGEGVVEQVADEPLALARGPQQVEGE